MIEMLATITLAGILMSITANGMRTLNRQQRNERFARAVLWEVTVARSYALRSSVDIGMVFDPVGKKITVRDSFGNTYRTVNFGSQTPFAGIGLSINTDGDSLVFSPRGMCLNCDPGGTTTITLSNVAGRSATMTVGVLGRAVLNGFSRT